LSAPEFATPEEAEDAFYRAFERSDLEALMATWADAGDIICIHPGGDRLVGPVDVRESWRRIFGGGVKLAFRRAEGIVLDRPDIRVHSVIEEISLAGSGRLTARVCVTNIFVRDASGWHLWMHHGSNPGSDLAPETVDSPTPTLH
jgi:ketosteroid isomerase-like protein